MITNKLHQRRWDAAKKLFQRLKDKAEYFGYGIMFDSTTIKPEQIVITDDEINIRIDNCQYNFFAADSDMNHGVYETIGDYKANIKKQISLVKIINW